MHRQLKWGRAADDQRVLAGRDAKETLGSALHIGTVAERLELGGNGLYGPFAGVEPVNVIPRCKRKHEVGIPLRLDRVGGDVGGAPAAGVFEARRLRRNGDANALRGPERERRQVVEEQEQGEDCRGSNGAEDGGNDHPGGESPHRPGEIARQPAPPNGDGERGQSPRPRARWRRAACNIWRRGLPSLAWSSGPASRGRAGRQMGTAVVCTY